jgi:hypothetical protein
MLKAKSHNQIHNQILQVRNKYGHCTAHTRRMLSDERDENVQWQAHALQQTRLLFEFRGGNQRLVFNDFHPPHMLDLPETHRQKVSRRCRLL